MDWAWRGHPARWSVDAGLGTQDSDWQGHMDAVFCPEAGAQSPAPPEERAGRPRHAERQWLREAIYAFSHILLCDDFLSTMRAHEKSGV